MWSYEANDCGHHKHGNNLLAWTAVALSAQVVGVVRNWMVPPFKASGFAR